MYQEYCTMLLHYDDVIMDEIASQITSLTIVYSAVYLDADQRKHQSSASLAFVWGFTGTRTKGQLRGKCFHLMTSSWIIALLLWFGIWRLHKNYSTPNMARLHKTLLNHELTWIMYLMVFYDMLFTICLTVAEDRVSRISFHRWVYWVATSQLSYVVHTYV